MRSSASSEPLSATAVTRCSKSTMGTPLTSRTVTPGGSPASHAGMPGVGLPTTGRSAGSPANMTSGSTTSAKTTFMITPPE